MQSIENLTEPPVIGETYLVPCVYGRLIAVNNGPVETTDWLPVLTPAHQDSVYFVKYRIVLTGKTIHPELKTKRARKIYYRENNPNTPKHYHIDARFISGEFFEKPIYHGIVVPKDYATVDKPMVCLREMPLKGIPRLPDPFEKDYKGTEAKCNLCPHKQINLASMPIVDGKLVCPAHALVFNAKTKACLGVYNETKTPSKETREEFAKYGE